MVSRWAFGGLNDAAAEQEPQDAYDNRDDAEGLSVVGLDEDADNQEDNR